jgi:hypothetical protein
MGFTTPPTTLSKSPLVTSITWAPIAIQSFSMLLPASVSRKDMKTNLEYFFSVLDLIFSRSGDSANSSELTDNLVSFHWSSWNATVPDGFISRNEPVPLADGNDDIMPYWNVTIPAGETMTFMFIMNQGGYDMTEMYSSVKDIDANPLKLYTGKYSTD